LRVPEASVHASLQERRGTRWRNHASGADPDPQQVDRRRHLLGHRRRGGGERTGQPREQFGKDLLAAA
jgi:hypothetical protein